MRTFEIAQLVSLYRKEFNTEITEKDQSTESTEKKKKQNGSSRQGQDAKKKGGRPAHYKKPLQKHN